MTHRHRLDDPFVRFARAAYRFVFPPICPLCQSDIATTTLHVSRQHVSPVLCSECAQAVVLPDGNRCQLCGVSLGQFVRSDDGCPHCRSQGFRFDRVIRLGEYDGLLRQACIRGKGADMQPLAAALANQLWLAEADDFQNSHIDLVIPVPRYWTRRIVKDHHQAETLSAFLARRLRLPHSCNLLHKVRLTPDQSDLSAAQRRQNLHNAFAVWFGRRRIKGKTALLVDDVLTTGTTANECAKALKHAGAKRVIVAVVAVVPPHR